MVGLGRCQNTSGFVQNKDVGLTIKRLEDFHALLVADRQVFDQRIGIDRQFVFFGKLLQYLARLGQRIVQQPAFFGAQNDVFQNGKVLHQLEVLEHHADACGNRRLTVGDVGFSARNIYLARVGFVKAVEDRHQGGFTSTVFTDDAVDGAGHDADRNIFVGLYRAECLGDAFEFDRGNRIVHDQGPNIAMGKGPPVDGPSTKFQIKREALLRIPARGSCRWRSRIRLPDRPR